MARLDVNFRFWRRAYALNALKVCFERGAEVCNPRNYVTNIEVS